MGQPENANELCVQAKDLFDLAGNRGASASTMLTLGDGLFDEGNYGPAREDFDAARAVFREIGAQRDVRRTDERIGNVMYQEGKLHESESYYNKALQFDQEFHDVDALASDYGNIANVMDDLGDLHGALQMQLKSLAAFNEVKNNRGAGETINNLGNLSGEMGHLREAKKYFDQALSVEVEGSYRLAEPRPMTGLGDVMREQGDLAGAHKEYEQALRMAEDEKMEDYSRVVRLSIASLDLEEEKFSNAGLLARQVVESLGKTGDDSYVRGVAWAILSRSLAGEGNFREARSYADRALAISRRSSAKAYHFEPGLADAFVDAKMGKKTEARQELESMLKEAQQYGYQLYEYEFRLALCEINVQSGAATARSDAAALDSDAKSLGFLLIANKAHALAQYR
jgi:tetratricopeptide (TPR) repeat protein